MGEASRRLRQRLGEAKVVTTQFVRQERETASGRHPSVWRHGFSSSAHALYDFERHGVDAYLSDVGLSLLRRRLGNPAQRAVLEDKLAFHACLAGGFQRHLPTLHGRFTRGRLEHWSPGGPPRLTTLDAILAVAPAIVIKPLDGLRGDGVRVLRVVDGQRSIDGQAVTKAELEDFGNGLDGHLVQERLVPHDTTLAIFDQACSTLRVLYARDPATGETMIPAASHRFATSESAPTDNFSRGALAAPVDLATGTLGRAGTHGPGGPIWHDRHPETDAPIAGHVVPSWADVVTLVERLGAAFPFLTLVGWDLVVDAQGTVKVIEGNHGFGLRMIQMHAPLLHDDRFRALCERYRVPGSKTVRDRI